MDPESRPQARRGSAGEVFSAFLKLGLTSFGGPIAHLGYFRHEFVERRRWIDEAGYADLVALCQFLPGPASSQVGFSLGVMRGGLLGGLAAWCGFTLPSAVLLVLFAYGAVLFSGTAGAGVLHGLKIVAVAIVAQAVWGMARTLTPDRIRAAIAVSALVVVTLLSGAWGQIVAILGGALLGSRFCADAAVVPALHLPLPLSRRSGIAALVLFFVLLGGLPVLAAGTQVPIFAVFDAFYRSGALVFGGGHVVLPLLQASVVAPGWVGGNVFLAGYGAAQAVPGPLFSFAAYLGAVMSAPRGGLAGAALCLFALFLPGLLLVLGVLPFWQKLRLRPDLQAAMRGANAAVVGLLAAALYNPVWTGAVHGAGDFALAALAFVLLVAWRTPPWIVVLLTAAGGALLALV